MNNNYHLICCVFNYPPLYRFPIYREMSKRFECEFYFGDKVESPNIKQFDVSQLAGYKGTIRLAKIIKGFRWHSNIKGIFNRKYTDYIITGQVNLLVNWLLILYCKLTRKKIYVWTHGIRNVQMPFDVRIMTRLFYKAMDGIFMYNSYMCPNMISNGIDRDKLYVIHNSLDSHLQTALYEKTPLSDIYTSHFANDYPNLVFIGRIQKRMKLDLILDAILQLRQKQIYVNVTFVGEHVEGSFLVDLVNDKNLNDCVWFYGPSYNEEMNSILLYNADVCVVPGSIGLTAIHALSYGCPVITNDLFDDQMPEFEAIIDGVTGSFYENNNVSSLSKKIENWIGLDEKSRNTVREAARTEIEKNWNVDSQINVLSKAIIG